MSAAPARGTTSWLAFALCCSVWGSTFLFIRMGNDTTPPVWAAAVRLSLATVMFALITQVLRRPWPRGPQRTAAIWFGVIDFGISLPLLYWGEQRVPSGIAAVLYATIPLTTVCTRPSITVRLLASTLLCSCCASALVGAPALTSPATMVRWRPETDST